MPTDVQGVIATKVVETSDVQLTQKLAYHSNGQPEYIGEAPPGSATSDAKWRIQKLSYDASNRVTDKQWAGGNTNFDNVWDDRASETYS